MTHIPLKQTFRSSLYWNLLDSVGTQALLLVHHYFVRTSMSITFHGIYGTLLSLFYLAIILINMGLDYSLVPFFTYFTRTQKNRHHFIYYYLLPQWALVISAGFLLYLFAPPIFKLLSQLLPCSAQSNQAVYITPLLIPLIALSFITESIKKTIKYLLQLNFYVQLTSTVEFFGMLLYMALFWQAWLLGQTVTINSVWTVFLTVSALQCAILWIAFFYHISYLPDKHELTKQEQMPNIYSRVIQNRLAVYINQITGQLFSSNFLVPICAFYLDLNQASYVKIVSGLAQWITLVSHKVFGVSSSALLAQTKSLSDYTHRTIFTFVSSYFYQALCALLLFFIINGPKLVTAQITYPLQVTNWLALYAFLLISFIEGFLILYQNWYTFEEKAFIVSLANFMSFALFMLSISFVFTHVHTPIIYYFALIICLRLATLCALGIYSYYHWKTKPDFYISIQSMAIALLISVIFYITYSF